MNSNEKLVRQYVRESLIAERRDRGDVRRAGQSVGAGTIPDVIGWIGSVKEIIGHALGVISSIAYTGVAAYKGAESVFKIGAEGMKGLLGGGTPDYESIVTNQASTLRKARGFLGRDKPRPGIFQTMGLAKESLQYSLDTFSLENMSLDFLMEADASAGEEAEAEQIVDDAVETAAQEETAVEDPVEDISLTSDSPVDQGLEVYPDAVSPEEVLDPLAATGEEESVLVEPEIPEEVEAEVEVEEEILPPIDMSQVPELVAELSSDAKADMDMLLVGYRDAMSSQDLNSLAISLSSLMGRPGESGSFTPDVLAARVKKATGINVTAQDIEAGSENLFLQIRELVPDIFSGVIGGALDKVLSEISSDPPEVQEAIMVSIKPIYEATLAQIRPTVENIV